MTTLAPDTPWIDVLFAEEKAFDRLAAHNSRLANFRRVLNDERVAVELRVVDVGRMLGLPVGALLAVVQGREPPASQDTPVEEPIAASGWVADDVDRSTLDLRPVFERGLEPLAMILEEINRLPAQSALIVETPFHPVPLRRLLGGRGFDSIARQVSGDHWQVAFRRRPTTAASVS